MTNPSVVEVNPSLGERGLAHIYLPEGDQKVFPVLVTIHGGAWRNGDLKSFEWMWPDIQSWGVALLLLTYRLAPEHRYPCAYEDLCQSMKWLKEKGHEHRLDADKVVLFGGSAGGHLAMLLATRGIAEGRPMPVVRGVVDYCGIMDLAAQYDFDVNREKTMTLNFMGVSPAENPDLYREASPLCQIHGKMPPVWMAHGTADGTVPVEQSRAMVEKLREAGCEVSYREAEGAPHTLVELAADGKAIEPKRLLFKPDLQSFVQKSLLGL